MTRTRTRIVSLAMAGLGLGLLLWLGFDASHVAGTLGLDTAIGEAGVALLGLGLSGLLLLVGVLPLRHARAHAPAHAPALRSQARPPRGTA